MKEIPVIDFSAATCPSARDEIAGQVFKAMNEIGFMYISHHGIPQEKVDAVFQESQTFFTLSKDVKVKYNVDVAKGYGGYTQLGKHIFNIQDSNEIRECFSVENPDVEFTHPVTEVPGLLPAIEELRRACQPLVRTILTLLGKALKLENEEYLLQAYNGGNLQQIPALNRSMMRSSWYPAIPEESETVNEKSVRCSQHTDYGILTLLFQDEVGGLEVQTLDGSWLEATAIPNTVLINTGDILELWTGGTFRATPHRIRVPARADQRAQNRQSVIFLAHADDDALVAPIESPLIQYKEGKSIEPTLFKVHYERRMNVVYGVNDK